MSEAAPEPRVLPALPLRNTVVFPLLVSPLSVARPVSVAAVEAALATPEKTLVIVAQKNPAADEPGSDDLHAVGTLAVIKKMERSEEGFQLIVQGLERVTLREVQQSKPYLQVRIEPLAEPSDTGTVVEAQHRAVLDLVAKIRALVQPEVQLVLLQVVPNIAEPLHQLYMLVQILDLDAEKAQALLEAPTRTVALRLAHEYLSHELQVLELRDKIASRARNEISREQREYVLRQQMQAIQSELGEADPEQAEVDELRRRLEGMELPESVRHEVQRELEKLERLPAAAPDYQLSRSYVELLVELPWTALTQDVLDLKRARQVLDEDHFDLKEVKERIVEHLAIMKLNPGAKAPILCFVGPPGVGKTSLGQSIARALERKFERMSLGGMHDEAELRGHRRTYIGAMPGRIIQALQRAKVKNPLVMLDEVDKLGRDFRGDPAAALMEILDPAQNTEFRDNYLNVPFDLSQVFFITTANTLDSIPQPLLDRMETLRLPGYSDLEKTEIAKRYLIPRQREQAGLRPEQIAIPDETVSQVIRSYTREAGVRQLERALGRLARKVAVRFAEGLTEAVTIRPADLAAMLGPQRFHDEVMRRDLPAGVAAGLAWTESGGEVLYVEALQLPGGKGMTLTGHLGEVMQESAKAAQSYIWSRAAELGIPRESLEGSGVHVHVPAGAIPKDGPSAGVTMTAALASIYTRCPARGDTAMTGEISLTGLVLPVGGIKEKVLGAHRAGIRRVILPRDNENDLADLSETVREEIEFVLVEKIDDVLAAALPGLAARAPAV